MDDTENRSLQDAVPSRLRRSLMAGAAWLAAGLPAVADAREAATLRAVTAHFPPLVIESSGASKGALFDVVTELCRRVGVNLSSRFVPWKRALFLTTSGNGTLIFPLTRIPERERQFRWLVPLYDEQYVFLAKRGGAFDVRNPANMKDMRIALIRGSALKEVLRKLGYHHFAEARSVDEVHRFLVAGIADAAYGERTIVRNSLRSRRAVDDFDVSEPASATTAWLAGSLDLSDARAAQFQRAMKEMKADGSYHAILRRYQLG